jgi:hypothetical protein
MQLMPANPMHATVLCGIVSIPAIRISGPIAHAGN